MTLVAHAYTPNGTQYVACTTIQFGYKPLCKSTTITVEPQATQETTPTKTPEQIQQEAKQHGLRVWGPDSFSWWIPFFKFHSQVAIDWLGMNVHTWIGLFDCGIDAYAGLGRLLQKGFENAPTDSFDLITSAFISSMAATTTLFVTSLTAATFTYWTPAYWITLAAYVGVGAAIIGGFYALADVYTARAVLFGVGATLLGLLIGAYSANTLVKSIPFVITAELTGSDPVRVAIKSITNSLVNNYLGVTSAACQLVFRNPLMTPFTIATLGLAVSAIVLGFMKH